MGSLYRSEEMAYCELFLQAEAAYTCIGELGELALVQFCDLNAGVNMFQRKFVNEIRRFDEMERKLRFVEKEMEKDKISIAETGENLPVPAAKEIIDLEATFDKLEADLVEVNANAASLGRNRSELTEMKHILQQTDAFFQEKAVLDEAAQAVYHDEEAQLAHVDVQPQLGFVAGVIVRQRMPAFERMLWRICHGNVYVKQAEIGEDLHDMGTGAGVKKNVFVVFFQGQQLKSRVRKVCQGFHAALYPCPESSGERAEMIEGVKSRLADLQTVLAQTVEHRDRLLVAAGKQLNEWLSKVRKMKAIHFVLNMCNLDVTRNCFIAECWCPVADLPKVRAALRSGMERSGSTVPSILNKTDTSQTPPTFIRLNKFTRSFQGIVNAYGVPSYREVNAAPWAMISFPFLFAVMFGDMGHGFLMFLFALTLVVLEKKLAAQKNPNEIFMTFFNGRYLILLMGLFSVYTGLLYNDCFSKGVNLFGTGWSVTKQLRLKMTDSANDPSVFCCDSVQLDPVITFNNETYLFGQDPIWSISTTRITFSNSLKMKTSIILGISQMVFGIILSFFNHVFFRQWKNIFCEFIPEMLFMLSIFGYLVGLIFYKWIMFDAAQSLINMFMFKYNTGDPSVAFFDGLKYLQMGLVAAALISIPWLLFTKPIVLYLQHKKRTGQRNVSSGLSGSDDERVTIVEHMEKEHSEAGTSDQEENSEPLTNLSKAASGSVDLSPASSQPPTTDHHRTEQIQEKEEEFDMTEILVHQGIHTIEFVLGAVSNTASYLRLWALSLAHGQLSEVLWTMVLRMGLRTSVLGAVMLIPIFAFWAVLTVAILLLMEGLSAFLHALRLHWVEFQSKFYAGNGYQFLPFDFTRVENGGKL